jgi:hypothetical protein
MRDITRSFARLALATLMTTGLIVGLPLTALANGPLAVCTPGQPFLWPAGGTNIPYNPDQGSLGPLPNGAAVALLATAFGAWGAIPTATTTYLNAGSLPVDVDINNFGPFLEPAAPDGLSAIVFDDTGEIFDLLFGPDSGVLGFAGPEWVDGVSCDILEGVAFLNGPAFGNATEALDVLVHEFGHYQNLAHTVVNGQIGIGDQSGPTPNNTFGVPVVTQIETMYPFYFGAGSGTASPHADDIAGLSTLYPAPGFFAATGAISGTIIAPNGTTKLTGVNVIARNVLNPFNDAVSALSSDFTTDYSQTSALAGRYTLRGLTPGAQYAVFVDEILEGGFSTPPLTPLPGPEEFYNGVNESTNGVTDAPAAFTPVTAIAGVIVNGVDILFNAPVAGVPLSVGDDGFVQLFLPFTFKVCGQSFDSVFANANGSVTFGQGSTDLSESRFEFLDGPPRAAGLWDDLNPAAGGTVTFGQTANTFTVSWTGVPEFPATGSNTFSVKLYRLFDRIDVSYGGMTAVDGLAGVSCGGNVTSRYEQQQDLSRFPIVELISDPAGFEIFSPQRPFDLANRTLHYTGTLNYNDRWAGHNNTLATAKRVSLPFTSNSVLQFTEHETPGDIDFFKFRAKAGQILVAETLTGRLDTLIGLFDSAGNLLAFDDDLGDGVLSRLAIIAPADGDYIVGVTQYPDFGFTGAGAGETGRYVLGLQALTGTLLPVGDDSAASVALGFNFPFQGSTWTSAFVNGNGNLTFGSANADFSESVAELLSSQPRIAALWDDLDPSDGLVVATPEPGALTIHFVTVPEFFTEKANDFSIRLDSHGNVTFDYLGVLAQDGLVGITQGAGAADPGPSDLSRLIPLFPKTGTTYELFTPAGALVSPFDLPFRKVVFK